MYNLPELENQKEYQNHVENELSNNMLFSTWKITYMQQQYSSKKRLSLTIPNVFIKHRVGLEKDNEKVIVRFITLVLTHIRCLLVLSLTFLSHFHYFSV